MKVISRLETISYQLCLNLCLQVVELKNNWCRVSFLSMLRLEVSLFPMFVGLRSNVSVSFVLDCKKLFRSNPETAAVASLAVAVSLF